MPRCAFQLIQLPRFSQRYQDPICHFKVAGQSDVCRWQLCIALPGGEMQKLWWVPEVGTRQHGGDVQGSAAARFHSSFHMFSSPAPAETLGNSRSLWSDSHSMVLDMLRVACNGDPLISVPEVSRAPRESSYSHRALLSPQWGPCEANGGSFKRRPLDARRHEPGSQRLVAAMGAEHDSWIFMVQCKVIGIIL